MKKLPAVGTVEYVSFPDDTDSAVPAKIDTGADSSAIWASNIAEVKGYLTFTLFGANSPFYTGKQHKTKQYQLVSIKNSFGHTEMRYKVYLRLNLADRTIRAKFTLADRSKNRYPILIGRRTLRGKFLVDVSRHAGKTKHDILMLSTKRTQITEKFAKNVTQSGKKLAVTYAAYEDLRYTVGPTGPAIRLGDRDIASFSLVHFKTTARYLDIAAATARYLEAVRVPFIDEVTKYYPSGSKLYQYFRLRGDDLLVPLSIFLFPEPLQMSFTELKARLGLPFVLKDIHGNKGEHNYLVKDKRSFDAACRQAKKHDLYLIAQAFIPNDGDYRVLVFGSKISLVIYRQRQSDDTHLNNTSQGSKATLIPTTRLPATIQAACLQAAKVLERQVAGVDIVQDKVSGLWYCLEVNDGPQLATGSFAAEKHAAFAAYLERKLAP